jgi:hypothetical protein
MKCILEKIKPDGIWRIDMSRYDSTWSKERGYHLINKENGERISYINHNYDKLISNNFLLLKKDGEKMVITTMGRLYDIALEKWRKEKL